MKKIFAILFVLSTILFVACTPVQPPVDGGAGSDLPDTSGPYVAPEIGTFTLTPVFNPEMEIELTSYNSVNELLEFVKANEGMDYYYSKGFRGDVMPTLGVEMMDGAFEAESMGGAPLDYSETNVQVEGVDEADIIKTDGHYIYTVSGDTLFIIKAYPGEDAKIVSTIEFEDRPTSLFIKDDKLAVFGNFYNLDYFEDHDLPIMYGMTYFDVYDISDRNKPVLEKEYKFEGNYFEARMIDEYVYFIVRSTPQVRPIPMPIIIEDDIVRNMEISTVRQFNIPYEYPEFATVHAINLDESTVNSETVVVENSQNLYMSHKNIYITYTEHVYEEDLLKEIVIELVTPRLSSADKELIEKIKKTDNDVLSQYEKEQKIFNIIQTYVQYMDRDDREELEDESEKRLKEKLEEYEHLQFTIIHKISVDEEDIDVVATSKVPGRVNNQFSMDERKNVLRIATTVDGRWSRFKDDRTESMNSVYTLDKNLKVLGKLEGLGETETIFSTRFIGDRLYMVTFRQVDPFFVIDLSDPENIKELGKLKIPGFSRYLHPYDEDTVIGIGREADEDTGRTEGIKISLFDVSDVSNPKEVAKFVTKEKWAQTTAEWEHKAFLFSREKELLVIPAYNNDWDDERESYNGAMVFKITKDEIDIRGIIDHSEAASRWYQPTVERSLYIEELLYTKSPNLLRINKIDDLKSVKDIKLEHVDSPYPIY
ncbi:beta-propeller domain-containing protein [Nanoarchaeota archaeon]